MDYPLWLMLLVSLLGVMSGISSIRGLADFMERHEQEVADLFDLEKAKLPRYSSLRRMLHHVNAAEVATIFAEWVAQQCPLEAHQRVALDGKSLGSTVKAAHTARQDFISVVSACVHQHGWVVAQTSFHNGGTSEIGVVQAMLQQFNDQQVWVTLDALHTQKKRLNSSSRGTMTTASG